jgi:hypothetical protein
LASRTKMGWLFMMGRGFLVPLESGGALWH